MWVFAYGSLMSDGWEKTRGCVCRTKAELQGYSRIFNKASIRNWGSKQSPCPTLNLIPSASVSCAGIAFQFPDELAKEIVAYLKEREGRDFNFPRLPIRLDGGATVQAIISIYRGRNTIDIRNSARIAEMVVAASGRDGPCIRYIHDMADLLRSIGVDDPTVNEISSALARLKAGT